MISRRVVVLFTQSESEITLENLAAGEVSVLLISGSSRTGSVLCLQIPDRPGLRGIPARKIASSLAGDRSKIPAYFSLED